MITISPSVGKGLTAQVIRASELRDQRLTLYRRAVEVLESRKQWPGGHEELLSRGKLQGRDSQVVLRNEGGQVVLQLYRQGRTMNDNLIRRFPMLILTGNGWERVAGSDEGAYLVWNTETQRAISQQR
jgi:hypothetical protein